MVGTMAPIVYRSTQGRKQRWLLVIGLYTLGALIGGVLLGFGLSVLGALFFMDYNVRHTVYSTVTGVGSLLYASHELGLLQLPYPQVRRQVPDRWRYRFHPGITAVLFGFLLGLAYATYIPVSTVYIITLAATLRGEITFGIIAFVLFALGRAALLWLLTPLTRNSGLTQEMTDQFYFVRPMIRVINAIALAFTGGYLMASWLIQHPR